MINRIDIKTIAGFFIVLKFKSKIIAWLFTDAWVFTYKYNKIAYYVAFPCKVLIVSSWEKVGTSETLAPVGRIHKIAHWPNYDFSI